VIAEGDRDIVWYALVAFDRLFYFIFVKISDGDRCGEFKEERGLHRLANASSPPTQTYLLLSVNPIMTDTAVRKRHNGPLQSKKPVAVEEEEDLKKVNVANTRFRLL
jgi:hypothetical protein